MKKSLLLAAAALFAFSACTDDIVVEENTQVNQPKEIAFAPLGLPTTRTSATTNGAITNTTFPTGLDMMVVAYDATNSTDFFSAANFKYQYAGSASGASHSYWGGETAHYWPLSQATINFLAIANANDDNATSVTWGSTAKASDVTIVQADNYAYSSKQHDLLYAAGSGSVSQTGNTLSIPEKVDMTFRHAQAYLVFNVKAADAASCAIKIKNIEISGARFAGTVKIGNTNYTSTASTAYTTLYWNPTTQTDAYKSVLDNQTAFADEATSYTLTTSSVQKGQIIVVPNMTAVDTYTDNGTTKIKITYYLESNEYNYEYEITNDKFEAGKKYIYNITFKLHEIFINPDVTNWTNDATEFVSIPPVSTVHETDVNITANEAGIYTVYVTGLGTSEAYTVSTTDSNSILEETPATSGTSDASGVATIKFKAKASTGTATATITLTKTSDSTTTTITVSQS